MQLHIPALAFLVLVPAASFGQPPQTPDPVVKVAPGDPEMTQAISKAQASLDRFIASLRSPKSWQQSFLVKGRFTTLGEVEHIWVADLTFDGRVFQGVLANEPRLPGLKFKQLVTVSREDVSDWMYIANNKLVGGYTIRVLRKRQSKEQREREDASRPYSIDDEG